MKNNGSQFEIIGAFFWARISQSGIAILRIAVLKDYNLNLNFHY